MGYEWARKLLLENRRQIEDRINDTGFYGLNDSMGDELSELSLYDNHPADVASELFEREKDLGVKINDKQRLAEIDIALFAIEKGTYGTCGHCGQPIGSERLEANPASILCVSCKEEEEASHPNRKRPIEEDFLFPGFGRTDLDRTDNVAFDGEDAWQAVERFNDRHPDDVIYEDIDMDDSDEIGGQVEWITNEEYRNQLPS